MGATTPTRDLTYVEDTVRGFIAAGEAKSSKGEIINLGNNSEISIYNLVELIAKLMDVKITIEGDKNRKRPSKSEVDRLWADNTKAKKILKWAPAYNLEDGLNKTIAWFKEGDHLKKYKSEIYNV